MRTKEITGEGADRNRRNKSGMLIDEWKISWTNHKREQNHKKRVEPLKENSAIKKNKTIEKQYYKKGVFG